MCDNIHVLHGSPCLSKMVLKSSKQTQIDKLQKKNLKILYIKKQQPKTHQLLDRMGNETVICILIYHFFFGESVPGIPSFIKVMRSVNRKTHLSKGVTQVYKMMRLSNLYCDKSSEACLDVRAAQIYDTIMDEHSRDVWTKTTIAAAYREPTYPRGETDHQKCHRDGRSYRRLAIVDT